MGGLERRLSRLEGTALRGERIEDEHEREKRDRMIRDGAEGANDRRRREGEEPVFEITEEGAVFCTHDGRPVTNYHQTLAEEWYWQELEWGFPGLVHDEGAQAFYTPSGELAISRDRVDLRHLMGKERDEA